MVLNVKSLIGIPVRTVAGVRLGKVQSFSLDLDTGKLAYAHVRGRGVVHVLEDELLVSWSDMISIDATEVVVRDGVVPVRSSALVRETGRSTTT